MTQKQGRILVVDDNQTNRLTLSLGLKHQGHEVSTAENGRKALDLLREQDFDLVLLDIVMPEMDGYQVLEQMHQDESLRNIPVIVISALDQMDSVVKCIKMGAEDHLPKSFDPVLLKVRIRASLEKKWLRDQEIEYLQQVNRLTQAAAAVEEGNFELDMLLDIVDRPDQLGQLAHVFQRMAQEVQAREQRLKQKVQQLRIEIDKSKQAKEVEEITATGYFRTLRSQAEGLRKRLEDTDE